MNRFGQMMALMATLLVAACAGSGSDDLTVFAVPWDPAGRASLAAHADAFAALSPQWVLLKTSDGDVTVVADPHTDAILAKLGQRPKLLPLVANAHDGVWDGAVVAALVGETPARAAVLDRLRTLAQEKGFSGYVFDLENLSPETVAAMPGFVQAVAAKFQPAGLEFWLAVPVGPSNWPLQELQQAGVGLVLMAYDQCWDGSGPGPVAGTDWFSAQLSARLEGLDKRRAMVALASYAYDWPPDGRAKVLSVAAARALAGQAGVAIERKGPDFNATFAYPAADGMHTVWFVDAPAFSQQRAIVHKLGVGRIALWRLGLEDDGLWTPGLRTSVPPPHVPATPSCEPRQN
jgi:peptidoglycan-N-acetylglucosamine deacetylase